MPPDHRCILVQERSDWYQINKAWNGALGENLISIVTGYPNRSVQNSRLGTKCRLRVQTNFQLFRGHLSQLLALLWNIQGSKLTRSLSCKKRVSKCKLLVAKSSIRDLKIQIWRKLPTWRYTVTLSCIIILTKLIWSRWLDNNLDVDCISVHNNEKETWLKDSHLDQTSGQQPAYFHWLQILLTYPTVRAQRFIDLSKINALLIFLSKLLWTSMEVHKILPAVLCLVSVWEPCIKWSCLQFEFLSLFCHDLQTTTSKGLM